MSDTVQPTQPRSSTLRSFTSLLLCLHFLVVAVGIVGGRPDASPLMLDVLNAPLVGGYARLLLLHRGFHNRWTDALPSDTEHRWRLELADGGTVSWPPRPLLPTVRQRRLSRLSSLAAEQLETAGGDPEVEGLIPYAVAQRLLLESEVFTGKHHLQLLQRQLPNMLDHLAAADPREAAELQTAFEADVWFHEGEVQLYKASPPAEAARARDRGP